MNTLYKMDAALRGAPDHYLTLILLGLALFAVVVAFTGPPLLKVTVALWFLVP